MIHSRPGCHPTRINRRLAELFHGTQPLSLSPDFSAARCSFAGGDLMDVDTSTSPSSGVTASSAGVINVSFRLGATEPRNIHEKKCLRSHGREMTLAQSVVPSTARALAGGGAKRRKFTETRRMANGEDGVYSMRRRRAYTNGNRTGGQRITRS